MEKNAVNTTHKLSLYVNHIQAHIKWLYLKKSIWKPTKEIKCVWSLSLLQLWLYTQNYYTKEITYKGWGLQIKNSNSLPNEDLYRVDWMAVFSFL